MPVRDTFESEISHLIRDKRMPKKQAVAVAFKYKRQGAFKKHGRSKRRRKSRRRQ